jgi:molybdenum cofactor cytidylyltransferase
MKEDSRISAVVLAAGTSSRMGRPKQLLPIDGRPLVQHVLDTARHSGISEIVLVLGHAAEAIQPELELSGVRVVVNENYRQGMGSSLKVGLSSVDPKTEAALVMLADQPFVHTATLDRLIVEHAAGKAQIVIPTYRGFRGNPVLLDRSMFPDVMRISGDIGCRAIFGDHLDAIVKLPVEDVGILLDLDQRSDYQNLRSAESRAERERALMRSAEVEERRRTGDAPMAIAEKQELVIVGKDVMATTLAKLARLLDFTVTIADPLLGVAETPEADRVLHSLNFSLLGANRDRHVVVASRGACDEEAIEQALAADSAYVALVANKKRGEEVLRGLRMKGVAPEKLAGVKVPAGLEIGAEGPDEIALSILAEIVAERRKRSDGPRGSGTRG